MKLGDLRVLVLLQLALLTYSYADFRFIENITVTISDFNPYSCEGVYHTCYANYLMVEISIQNADIVTNAIKFYDPSSLCSSELSSNYGNNVDLIVCESEETELGKIGFVLSPPHYIITDAC